MQWFILVVVGVGFASLVVWVNLYALDDDTLDPGEDPPRPPPGERAPGSNEQKPDA